jgi:hypothetical protein
MGDDIQKLKDENRELRKLLEEAVKGNYGIWSAWCDRVKQILKPQGGKRGK